MPFVNQVFSFNHLMNMNFIKSLCVAVGLITICLVAGDTTITRTRNGKSLNTSICSYFFLILPFQVSLRIMVIESGDEDVTPR